MSPTAECYRTYDSYNKHFHKNIITEAGKAQQVQRLSYGLDDRRIVVHFKKGQKFWSSLKPPDQFWTHQAQGAFVLREKRPGREAEYSPPSSAEVKMTVSITIFLSEPSWRVRETFNFTCDSTVVSEVFVMEDVKPLFQLILSCRFQIWT